MINLDKLGSGIAPWESILTLGGLLHPLILPVVFFAFILVLVFLNARKTNNSCSGILMLAFGIFLLFFWYMMGEARGQGGICITAIICLIINNNRRYCNVCCQKERLTNGSDR